MKRIMWLLAILLIGTSVAFIGGCSDDDSGTNPDVKTPGDIDDPAFEAMEDVFAKTENVTSGLFSLWFRIKDSVDSHPDNPGAPGQFRTEHKSALIGDSIYLTYHEDTDYWYLYMEDSTTIGYGEGSDSSLVLWTLIDSVQFMHGLSPAKWPDSALLTGINTGVYSSMVPDGIGFEVTAGQRLSIVGDIPNWGDVTANGTQSTDVSYTDTVSNCSFGADMNAVFTNLLINLEALENDGCPQGGTIGYAGTVGISCTGVTTFSLNDSWTVVETFTTDSVHYVVENSTHRWEWSEDCGYQPTTTHVELMFQAIRE